MNRYAAGGTAQDNARQDLSWSYVIANPSSYMYFSNKRAVPGTTDKFEVPNVTNKSSYNYYKYGLENLNKYMSTVGISELKQNYKERDVNILLGLNDTDTINPNLDTSAAAMLQGDHRLEREEIYFNHLWDEFGSSITALHDIDYVPNVGHSGGGMFRSAAGLEQLFGDKDSAPVSSGKSIVGNTVRIR